MLLTKRLREVEFRAGYFLFQKIYSLNSTHPFYIQILEKNLPLWERLQKFNQKLTKRVRQKRETKEQLLNSFINQSSRTYWMQHGFKQEKDLRFKTYLLYLYLINKALQSFPTGEFPNEDFKKVHFTCKEFEPLGLNNIRTLKSCLDELQQLDFEFIITKENKTIYKKSVGLTQYSFSKIEKVKSIHGEATVYIKFFTKNNPFLIFESIVLINFQKQNSLGLRNLAFSKNIQKAIFFITEKKPMSSLVLDFRTYVSIKRITYQKHQDIFISLIKQLQVNETHKVKITKDNYFIILTYKHILVF